jgi:hypothetical protein
MIMKYIYSLVIFFVFQTADAQTSFLRITTDTAAYLSNLKSELQVTANQGKEMLAAVKTYEKKIYQLLSSSPSRENKHFAKLQSLIKERNTLFQSILNNEQYQRLSQLTAKRQMSANTRARLLERKAAARRVLDEKMKNQGKK